MRLYNGYKKHYQYRTLVDLLFLLLIFVIMTFIIKNYFKPFMTIKYYNKNYPEGKNTLSLANYYYLKYDLEVNLNNISLTNEEKDNAFKIIKIPKDQILEYLNNSLTKATRINVTKDTIKVLEEVLNNKTLNYYLLLPF